MIYFMKVAAHLLFPLPLCTLLFAGGLVLLWFTRREGAGKVLVTVGTLLLFTFGNTFFSGLLIGSLENDYPVFDPQERAAELNGLKYVVVLGGGTYYNDEAPGVVYPDRTTMNRLAEGIRLFRQLSGSKLVLSGGGAYGQAVSADAMERVARRLGVDGDDIIVERESINTYDEARLLKPLLGGEPFLLVTSANHMPRSMALFRGQGLDPVAAPVDFLVAGKRYVKILDLFPSVRNLYKTETAFYEYLGWVKERVTGHI